MPKRKKKLHPADEYRKKLRKKELKRNKGLRKIQREAAIQRKTPNELLDEILKIERQEAMGQVDEKVALRKKKLQEAHKSLVQKIQEQEEKKKKDDTDTVVIKGMTKIFRNAKVKKKTTEDDDEKQKQEEDDEKKKKDEDDKKKDEDDKKKESFLDDEEKTMFFDDTIVPTNPAVEDLPILAEPPGLSRPPGLPPPPVAYVIDPNEAKLHAAPDPSILAMGRVNGPVGPVGPPLPLPVSVPLPVQGPGPDKGWRPSPRGFDPMDPNPETNPLYNERFGGALGPQAGAEKPPPNRGWRPPPGGRSFDPMDPNPETNPLYNERFGGALGPQTAEELELATSSNEPPTVDKAKPLPAAAVVAKSAAITAKAKTNPPTQATGLAALAKMVPTSLLVRNRLQPQVPPAVAAAAARGKKPVRTRPKEEAKHRRDRVPAKKVTPRRTSSTQAAYDSFMKEIENL